MQPAIRLAVAMSVLAAAAAAHAADAPSAVEEGGSAEPEVSGTIALGVINASGNTESTSTNLDVDAEAIYARWSHNALFNAYAASEEGDTNAERYGAQLKSKYRFSERAYVFGLGRYESNRFGAYDRSRSLAFGLGRRFVDHDRFTLDLEVGAGRRELEPRESDETETETTGVLRGDAAWAFSKHGELSQTLEIEGGDVNTFSRSVSSLTSKLTEDLAWRLSYTVEHNSEVPADVEQTDTFTTVSLQYGF